MADIDYNKVDIKKAIKKGDQELILETLNNRVWNYLEIQNYIEKAIKKQNHNLIVGLVQLVKNHGKFLVQSRKYIDPEDVLSKPLQIAMKIGDIISVKYLLEQGARDLRNALIIGAKEGQLECLITLNRYAMSLPKEELKKRTVSFDFSEAFKFAAEYGQIDVMNYMIYQKYPIDWGMALERASRVGNSKSVNYIFRVLPDNERGGKYTSRDFVIRIAKFYGRKINFDSNAVEISVI